MPSLLANRPIRFWITALSSFLLATALFSDVLPAWATLFVFMW
jgi:hypothetical protein